VSDPAYHWIWYTPVNASRPPKAHAFREDSTRSVCGYADRSRADATTDIALQLKPRRCVTCEQRLRLRSATATNLVVTPDL
jgi:hypothetical protein